MVRVRKGNMTMEVKKKLQEAILLDLHIRIKVIRNTESFQVAKEYRSLNSQRNRLSPKASKMSEALKIN
jgi:hypothetical protein